MVCVFSLLSSFIKLRPTQFSFAMKFQRTSTGDEYNLWSRPKFVVTSVTCNNQVSISIDISLTVKAATLMFISGRGSAISSAKEGKSGSFYHLVKNK